MIFFQDILFLKEFLACNICFGLFTKVKKGSGTNILCKFSVWLFHKNVPYLIHYQWTKFQCHTFFPSWYIIVFDWLSFMSNKNLMKKRAQGLSLSIWFLFLFINWSLKGKSFCQLDIFMLIQYCCFIAINSYVRILMSKLDFSNYHPISLLSNIEKF